MIQITQMDSWKALEQQALKFSFRQKLITHPPLLSHNISLDYSAQCIDLRTRELLLQLAEECNLPEKIEDMFVGQPINTAENKPALHCALRSSQKELMVANCNIMPGISAVLESMRDIANTIRAGEWLGFSGKPVTDIVNIGIGGSQLGPAFCLHALTDFTLESLQYHFISDLDCHAFARATKKLNPETTLFIVSSKSFTTAETIYNVKKAIAWLNQPNYLDRHFIAVTANPEKAIELGFNRILPIWDWIGGRYSVCSAINLITCIAVGFKVFSELLHGAEAMDNHFRDTPLSHNLPIHLALLGIWANNFLKIHQLLLLTYAHNLDYFTSYIQQLDMESNGKSIDQQGRAVSYATGPIVWGGSGNQAQHSYYQLLCQGTHQIAADFISVGTSEQSAISHLCCAQKEVLSKGIYDEHNANGYISGHAAINHLRLKDTSPSSIGALIALYEHKIYAQSVIWQINAFDQPGVESSKRVMQRNLNYA